MTRSTVSPLLVLCLLAVSAALPAPIRSAEGDALDGPPKGWPDSIEIPAEPPAAPGATGLPEPTVGEPFEIGEALYDPARAADAALSLLELLGVPIGEGDGNWVRPPQAHGGAPFSFTEPETHAFLRRAVASAEAATQSGEPILKFADLYRAVAPQLPGWSIEQLAEAYTRAYEAHPDDIAPRVLMGQPITPETPLLYPQLWLLVVDAFAPPEGTPRPGRATPASAPAASGGTWGTAAQLAPPLTASWAGGVIPHLGQWIYINGPDVLPNTPRAHEGHGGPGAPVPLVAQFVTSPQPIVRGGHVWVDIRRPPALAGLHAYWRSPDEQVLAEHGSFSVPLGQTITTDAAGSVHNVYLPKPEPANGHGRLMRDQAQIHVKVKAGEMAQAFYNLAPELGAWLFPDVDVEGERRTMKIEWHELETIDIVIENAYNVKIPLGPLGTANRRGRDTVYGTLAKKDDGTWYGLVHGVVRGDQQQVEGLGRRCPTAGVYITQDLHAVGTPIGDFGPTHSSGSYNFGRNPNGSRRSPADYPEKLSLEFLPASPPVFLSGRNRCWQPIPTPLSPDPFIPFNDAQWTIEHAGYGVALPEEGRLTYSEVAGAAAAQAELSRSTDALGQALGRLLTPANFGTSTWYVSVERKKVEP